MNTDETLLNPYTFGLITAVEMRTLEQAAIESGAVTGLELMERAGAGVVEEIVKQRPDPARAAVLCGPGNNGGDGYVVARLLQERGWEVAVFALGDPDRLPPDAKTNYERWREMGTVAPFVEAETPRATQYGVVVDALFGAGLTRPLDSEIAGVFNQIAPVDVLDRPVRVAIDVPSGLCMDSGRSLGRALSVDLTVTFEWARWGHVLAEGPRLCGRVVVKDIGLTNTMEESFWEKLTWIVEGGPHFINTPDIYLPLKHYGLSAHKHKYDHGHVLVVSGPMGRTGAARLAARAALRVGAGLVTIASPPSAMLENACHLTAIMLRKMRGPEGLAEILQDKRINSVVIGPGCGVGAKTRARVKTVLQSGRFAVLDADALTSFADDPSALFAMLHDNAVLTPHGGEFARLFPDIAARLSEEPTRGPAYSKVDAARDAAKRCGATVLFKGQDTVVARPGGTASIAAAVYEKAAPWLATAGSGDVLAGLIAGIGAVRSYKADAPASAAALHQALGRHCGPGLIAEDLPEAVPAVLAKLIREEPV